MAKGGRSDRSPHCTRQYSHHSLCGTSGQGLDVDTHILFSSHVLSGEGCELAAGCIETRRGGWGCEMMHYCWKVLYGKRR